MGRYRYIESVSVIGIFVGVLKVGIDIGIGILNTAVIGIGIFDHRLTVLFLYE